MENNYRILLNYNLSESDLNLICLTCPGIVIADKERLIKNISLVCQFGYPEIDINTLILINPSFLLENPMQLAKTLMSIGNNVEEKLKQNPFLL